MHTSSEIALRWMSQNTFDNKPTLVKVAIQQQDITCINVDLDLSVNHHMTSQWINSNLHTFSLDGNKRISKGIILWILNWPNSQIP